MKANELSLQDNGRYNFSLYYAKFCHSGGLNIQRAASGYSIWNFVLNSKDVADLESWFALNNIEGQYRPTKMRIWARCTNALTKEQMIDLAKWLRLNKATIAFFIKN